tara:strand:- start:560 stop:661 length:102 start_codon:yes stop_codon:yes gene_type:complete
MRFLITFSKTLKNSGFTEEKTFKTKKLRVYLLK